MTQAGFGPMGGPESSGPPDALLGTATQAELDDLEALAWAMAARLVIADVEHLAEPCELGPAHLGTPTPG